MIYLKVGFYMRTVTVRDFDDGGRSCRSELFWHLRSQVCVSLSGLRVKERGCRHRPRATVHDARRRAVRRKKAET